MKAARRKFARQYDCDFKESTLRRFAKEYRDEVRRRRSVNDLSRVCTLPVKKNGRPLLLGEIDQVLQNYITQLRAPITTAVVRASARGLLLAMDRSRLQEFGGPATLSIPWARSLLKRMNYTRRKATTKASSTDDTHFLTTKERFLQEIIDVVSMEDIPGELVLNWDQTGLNLIPAPVWTMEKRGTKKVKISGVEDKRQITGVFCASMLGEFLPIQLIYAGKTSRCIPISVRLAQCKSLG